MRGKKHSPTCLALTMALLSALLLAAVGAASPALAQSGGDYDLTWSTVDGGGWTFSAGGDYVLGGTMGQPDAELLRGGDYRLQGGFWHDGAAAAVDYAFYLPLVQR